MLVVHHRSSATLPLATKARMLTTARLGELRLRRHERRIRGEARGGGGNSARTDEAQRGPTKAANAGGCEDHGTMRRPAASGRSERRWAVDGRWMGGGAEGRQREAGGGGGGGRGLASAARWRADDAIAQDEETGPGSSCMARRAGGRANGDGARAQPRGLEMGPAHRAADRRLRSLVPRGRGGTWTWAWRERGDGNRQGGEARGHVTCARPGLLRPCSIGHRPGGEAQRAQEAAERRPHRHTQHGGTPTASRR